MKRKYELTKCINFIILLFYFLIIAYIAILLNMKIVIYKKYKGIIIAKDYVLLTISKNDLKNFYKNKIVYIDAKKQTYKIEKIVDKKNYNQIFIKIKLNKKYKENDFIDISLGIKKIKSINIFKVIWEG